MTAVLCFISSEIEICSVPFDITACHIINESMHRSFRRVGQMLFRPHRDARTADWKCRGDGGHDWLPPEGEMKRRRTQRLNKGEIEGEWWSEITSHSHQCCHYSSHQLFLYVRKHIPGVSKGLLGSPKHQQQKSNVFALAMLKTLLRLIPNADDDKNISLALKCKCLQL